MRKASTRTRIIHQPFAGLFVVQERGWMLWSDRAFCYDLPSAEAWEDELWQGDRVVSIDRKSCDPALCPRRKPQCPKGHIFDPANAGVWPHRIMT